MKPTDLDRFWAKVDKTDDCWLWASQLRNGYGLFRLNGKVVSAHRLSYEMHIGSAEGFQVRHTCDNPPCVNPEHLILGNAKANSDDKMDRDRHNFTFTNAQVVDLRSRPITVTMCRDIAKEFSVSTEMIKALLTGETYSWVDGAINLPPQFTGWKLTPEQVEEIQEALKTAKWGDQGKLAKRYGVTQGTISHIKKMRLLYSIPDTQ